VRILVGHDGAVSINEDAVVAVFLRRFPQHPDAQIKARERPDGVIWTVAVLDEQDRPEPGAGYFVGPDLRLWQISSNPSIHDYDLALNLLSAAYQEGLADHLDEEMFTERVHQLTRSRRDEVRQFVADLLAGSLRRQGDRHLP